MAQPYRYDFRQKVIQAIERDGLKKSEASQLFNISRNTIDLWFKRKAATGDVQAKQRQAASKRQQSTDWEQFRAFAKTHEAQTQVEMAHLWQGESSDRTLARALPKLGWTRKKTYGYRERDEAKRLEFLKRMGDPQAAHLVSVDESGMDERDDSGYGWSPAGERIDGLKTGRRQGRVNLIAGSRDGQLIAPFTVTGACNRTVFELWLETCLLPVLKPGDWGIVDHATCHHGGRIAQLLAAVAAQVVYLPPDSPDLNRIEKCWAWLKSRLRKQRRYTDSLHDAMNAVLKQAAS